MSEERDLQNKVQRADHAQRILTDDLVQEALSGMRDSFERQFTDAINGGKKARSLLKDILKLRK